MASVDETAWRDRQGDIWREGDDGLMHTPETAPFPPEYVEKKWGPLTRTIDRVVPYEISLDADASVFPGAGVQLAPKADPS